MIDETEYKRRLKESGLSDDEAERQWQMRLKRDHDHEWHVAINRHTSGKAGQEDWPKFMYQAKSASQEVESLARLFKSEREGTLPKTFRKCSCCADEKHVVDNHTFCCLGSECRKCPHLLALEKADMPIEEIDRAKAWTCVAHILSEGGDPAGEGFVLTVEDRMYWDSVYESLASVPPEYPAP